MKKLSLVLTLVFFVVGLSMAQRTITGTVSDASGETLIGASVLVKGTTSGTVTDFDGKYSLSAPEGAKILVFSYTGFESQEIELGTSNVVDITLAEGVTLGAAVVTALGISREKKTLGYSVQTVGGEATSEVRETNFVASLSGKVSGVNIRQPGTMGGSANVLIRGTTSLTGNNQALFVVNGVPISNTNTSTNGDGWGGYDYGNAAMDVNPDDIESISILKGAAATALYGSKAANGVILVTTKTGKKGKKGLGVTINSGILVSTIDESTLPQHQNEYGGGYGPFYGNADEGENPNFFNQDFDGDGTIDLVAPVSEDASWGEAFDPNLMVIHWDALDPKADNYGEKRPWVAGANGIDYFFQQGIKYTNSVAINGGGDTGGFRLSYTNSDETGVLPNSSIKRNTINFSVTQDFSDKLTVGTVASYVNTKGEGRFGTGYNGGNVMQSFAQWIQTNVDFARLEEKWLRSDGSQLSWNSGSPSNLHPIYFDNPYWVRYKNYEDDERNRLYGNVNASYKLTDWLSFSARVALDYYTENQNERIAVGSVDQSQFSAYTRTFQDLNTDLFLRANKYFGDISVSAMLGSTFNRNHIRSTRATTVGGLVVPDLYTVKNSVSPINITEYDGLRGTNSVFGNVSLGYKNMIYVEFSDRYDVSSTLPSDNNAYNYYSVSSSLILSELGGLKDVGGLSFAKLRASYAKVGADSGPYQTTSTYSQGTNWGNLSLFSVNSTLQNPDLRNEITTAVEVGLEARFMNNRFGFDFAAYKGNTTDQIMSVLVSRASGVSRRWVNGGEIENKGIELSLDATIIKTPDFTWNIGANWFANRNKVVSLYEDDITNLLIYSAWDASVNATVGQPYGTIRGTAFKLTNGKRTVDENGYYLKDTDEDGNVIGDAVIGNINPDWNMGLSTNVSFKGVSLRVLFDFQHGGDIYSINTKYGQATGVYAETAGLNAQGNPKRDRVADGGGILYEDTVNEDGTPNTTYVEAYRWGRGFYYNNSPTERYVIDASYVKLREAALSYAVPSSLTKKINLSNVVLSLVGRNLAILSKNTAHFDPEASQGSGNRQGIESGAYPTTRTIGFNIKVGF